MKRVLIYLWALPTTGVGLFVTICSLVSGGRTRIVDGVLETHGGFASFALRRLVLLKGGASAMTLGHVVIARDELCLDLTREHERVHVRQVERWGPLFIPVYLFLSLLAWMRGKNAYLDNPFEREAFDRTR